MRKIKHKESTSLETEIILPVLSWFFASLMVAALLNIAVEEVEIPDTLGNKIVLVTLVFCSTFWLFSFLNYVMEILLIVKKKIES